MGRPRSNWEDGIEMAKYHEELASVLSAQCVRVLTMRSGVVFMSFPAWICVHRLKIDQLKINR